MPFSPPPGPSAAPAESLLGRLLGHRPEAPAVGGGTRYGDLAAASAGLARVLLEGRRSLEGARIGVLSPPGPAFVEVLLAVWRAGGVAVPLSPLHPAPELAHILSVAAPESVVADASLGLHLDGALAGGGPRRLDAAHLRAAARVDAASPTCGRRTAGAWPP